MARFCADLIPEMLADVCGVPPSEAALIGDDILSRALAIAGVDSETREILAAPFFEESFSHDPGDAPVWLKAITTLVVRNSRLEEFHVSGHVDSGGIKAISTLGIGPLSHLIAASDRGRRLGSRAPGEYFGNLPMMYPRAWACCDALRRALTIGGGRVGYPRVDGPLPDLPDVAEVIEAQPAELDASSGAYRAVVFSGVDPRFDHAAIHTLQTAQREELTLGLSALSRISRNSGKLLRVLEILLAHKVKVLTTNCLLSYQDVWVRRGQLVKPDSREPIEGLRNFTGFGNSHRKTVESYLEEVSHMNE
jgi:hypothetical protein